MRSDRWGETSITGRILEGYGIGADLKAAEEEQAAGEQDGDQRVVSQD